MSWNLILSKANNASIVPSVVTLEIEKLVMKRINDYVSNTSHIIRMQYIMEMKVTGDNKQFLNDLT